MKNIIIYSLLIISLVAFSFTPLETHDYRVKKVVIDAGHGGKDTGTSGANTQEKDIVLKIALKLGKLIKENLKDVEVIYTRTSDKFLTLENRAKMANKNGADLFISIHCNSEHTKTVKGAETFVMGLHTSEENLEVAKRENSVVLLEDDYHAKYAGYDPNSDESHILFSLFASSYLENSLNLAQKIQYQFKNRVGRRSRGVKQAGFVVLWQTSMPSVLVECGFLSNKSEEQYLNDPLGQTYIASGLFRAFRDYKEELESIN
ncbi:N-acetylmuramoyl-L-alanine amidase [Aureibacter tunicatorum]|uniref:N-acetylmuramoyl-L-alanine amidase n=1 Tax=Aureibacter tunicatorum TaxID=866807 RepID=A0AAE3XKX6_9BACT|nr:N-acetylmuramoyl-L-alanine amidase [Aureibacter tunicatorum]